MSVVEAGAGGCCMVLEVFVRALQAGTTNDVIRTQVVRRYRQFVAEVDPKGGIMDHLIEAGVVSVETKERIVSNVTRQVDRHSAFCMPRRL